MSCGRAVQKDPAIERLSALLQRAGLGDQQAFAELHASTRNKLRKTALAVSPSIVDLDDLLQDAYLKIWNHAASFDPRRASPITWMCAIMRNTAIDALRLKQLATAELDEALSAMRRVIRWRIGDADVLEPNAAHTVQLRFRLDMSQLPRPLQIGAVGRSDWSLLVFRSQRLPSRAKP